MDNFNSINYYKGALGGAFMECAEMEEALSNLQINPYHANRGLKYRGRLEQWERMIEDMEKVIEITVEKRKLDLMEI